MASATVGDDAHLVTALAERYPSTAISHEWLTIPGGSENVVLALLDLLPQSEVITTVYDPDGGWPRQLTDRRIRPSVLNRLPAARRHYPKLVPLMDAAFRRFDVGGYDLVVSSNHACAKNVRTRDARPAPVHVCYCHTPMRYVWDPAFLEGERLGRLGHAAFRAALPHLRRTDLRGAAQVDRFVANSSAVAERIRTIYGRDATVVHPPVDVARFAGAARRLAPDAPYLVFGRVVPYKRVDQAVQACERLGRPLIVAGTGRDLDRVRSLAGRQTTFVGRVPDHELAPLFAGARALLFPGEEDFGIVPVEAQAAGVPVVGMGRGGIRDSVVDGTTGVLYDTATVDGLIAAIERFEALELVEGAVRANAERFAPDRFARAMGDVLLRATDTIAAMPAARAT